MSGYYKTKTKFIVIGRTVFWGHLFFDIFLFQFGLSRLYGGVQINLGFFGLAIRGRRYFSREQALAWYKKEFKK